MTKSGSQLAAATFPQTGALEHRGKAVLPQRKYRGGREPLQGGPSSAAVRPGNVRNRTVTLGQAYRKPVESALGPSARPSPAQPQCEETLRTEEENSIGLGVAIWFLITAEFGK